MMWPLDSSFTFVCQLFSSKYLQIVMGKIFFGSEFRTPQTVNRTPKEGAKIKYSILIFFDFLTLQI